MSVQAFTRGEFQQRMKVSPSRMDERIRDRLHMIGIHDFEYQKQYCLLSTVPEYTFERRRKAFYLDGPVHKGRRLDRDDYLRDLFHRRYGIQPIPIPYRGNSRREEDRVLNTIKEALK